MTSPRIPLTIAAVIAGAALAAGASAASTHVRTCHGLPVTIAASSGDVHGTPRADVIALTGPAHVEAGAGNDIICGSRRADIIEAGPGNDVVVGGHGADHLSGGPGRDRLYGDRGNDHLVGGPGADYLMGGRGRDVVVRGGPVSRGHDEQQFGDVVASGTRSISLVVDQTSLQSLSMTGSRFGTVMGDATAPFTLPMAWAVFQPMMANMISLNAQLTVYVADPSPVFPGMVIQPSSTVDASPGQTFTLNAGGVLGSSPTGGGPANAVSVMNASSGPAKVGLARQSWVNGVAKTPAPITVAPLDPGMVAQMQVPTQPTLFLTSQMTWPGQVMEPLKTGVYVLVVRSSPGSDTATVSFNINTGFTQD